MSTLATAYDKIKVEENCKGALQDEARNDLLLAIKQVKDDNRLSAYSKNLEINKLLVKALLLTSSYPGSGCFTSYEQIQSMEMSLKTRYITFFREKEKELEYLKSRLGIKQLKDDN